MLIQDRRWGEWLCEWKWGKGDSGREGKQLQEEDVQSAANNFFRERGVEVGGEANRSNQELLWSDRIA